MASRPTQRVLVDPELVNDALTLTEQRLRERIAQRGAYSYISNHEAYGLLAEEFYELLRAVQKNDNHNFEEELLDIAVGCIFALASKRANEFRGFEKHNGKILHTPSIDE